MNHDLKIAIRFWEAVKSGKKTFEIRYNDREFQVGDTVRLRAFEDGHFCRIRKPLSASIGYVTEYEQKEGFVVFSLLNVTEAS